jgi:hypothetical protein
MEQNVKWGGSQFGHKVIERQRQNFHEIPVNDYFVENPVFDERKVDLAKVRIAEVVVESKQEDRTTSGFELSDKEKSNALQRWHVKVPDRQAHCDLSNNLIEHVENFHGQGKAIKV